MDTELIEEPVAFPISTRYSLKTRLLLSILVLFWVGLWSFSYYASQLLHKDMEALVGDQQFSTVSVVADNLNEAIKERIKSLETVASDIESSQLLHPERLQEYIARLPLLKNYFNAGVLIFQADGVAIADTHTSLGRIGTNFIDVETVADALRLDKSNVGGLLLGKKLQTPVIGMTAPIRDGAGRVIGALTGVIDLRNPNFLDHITKYDYGKTGGYILVSHKQRMIVTATDKSRAMEVLPAAGISPLMDRFLVGYEGSGIAKNMLGVDVLVSAKGIPETDWYLAVSLPTAEAFAPIYNMQRHMWLVTGVLTLLAGVLTWWLVQRLLAPLASAASTLANMSTASAFTEPLPIQRPDEIGQVIGGFNRLLSILADRKEALKRNEIKFLEILENVEANIYLKDLDGKYLFANRPMHKMLGFSDGAIIGQSDDQFFEAETVAHLKTNDRRVLKEGITLRTDETVVNSVSGSSSTHISVKLPLRNDEGEIYALCGISTDITDRKLAEEELRIAAIAFECQEGMVVLDHEWRILRVNHAYTQITGYSREESEGKIPSFVTTDFLHHGERTSAWEQIEKHGTWHGELWHKHKSGKRYLCRTNVTAVRDEKYGITHLVGNFTDATALHWQEQQRQQHEEAHREALLREVHHRIKNNLQGITGLLHQFSVAHPETREPLDQAISQVRSIAVLHGLQGGKSMDTVRLCELTCAIANDVQTVWQTPISVDIPAEWTTCIICESEAVPMALVINELLVNAVKHSSTAGSPVRVILRKGGRPDLVQVSIQNEGKLKHGGDVTSNKHVGLQLVDTLMPRYGATLSRQQTGATVTTRLEMEPPVIALEQMEMHEPE